MLNSEVHVNRFLFQLIRRVGISLKNYSMLCINIMLWIEIKIIELQENEGQIITCLHNFVLNNMSNGL